LSVLDQFLKQLISSNLFLEFDTMLLQYCKEDAMNLKIILLTILLLLGLRYSNAQNGPIVSFTYDDGFSGWYDIAFPLFEQYGFPAVLYINATNSWVLTDSTIDKLHEMQAAGWEISNHTYDHIAITDSSVSLMKNWLDSLGFPNSGFAAPFNNWDHNMVGYVKKNSLYYCASGGLGISHPFDRYFLRRLGISNNISIETIKGYLDEAVASNLWIIFSGHSIGGTYGDPQDGFGQSAELIQMVFDEVVLRNIPVKTVREVINELYVPGNDIECADDSSQDPVLTHFEVDSLGFAAFNTSVWNEFWHDIQFWVDPRFSGSPVVYCHTSNDTLPVMKFYRDIPNGEYEVRATIIEYNPLSTYRLFYSFNDSVNTSQDSVDVTQNSDVSLGTVTITNGQFTLYTQNADVISGDEGYVGWAWIVLKPVQNSITANLKVLLEGPYNGSGTMTTMLNTNHLIPLTSDSAYPTATYSYNASVVGSIPDSSIVDWVFVELRTGTGPETKVASRAAFLKKDGTIVGTDGLSPVSFTGVAAGNYYAVVKHRNHISIMTATAIPLSNNSVLYDFTTSQSQAYTTGTDPMVALSGGGFGMIAGDGNNSTIITAADVSPIITNLNNSIYSGADVNMSAIITAADVTKIISNLNKSTNVP
jgi:hypothetical protein